MAASYGKKKWMIPAPAIGVKMLVFFFERFAWFPITRDQVTMLIEVMYVTLKNILNLLKLNQYPTILKH
ncbi:MAG: hypothetical protein Ct9H90mP20_5130 [Candidatus Neomarinimicrobiota bacterium]|nr:MAG: hypothetical protein Ct9H90mP20_5130 [Candidatus Neomarinimicrobiota bacterium]